MESRFKHCISLHNFNTQGRLVDNKDKERRGAYSSERQQEKQESERRLLIPSGPPLFFIGKRHSCYSTKASISNEFFPNQKDTYTQTCIQTFVRLCQQKYLHYPCICYTVGIIYLVQNAEEVEMKGNICVISNIILVLLSF